MTTNWKTVLSVSWRGGGRGSGTGTTAPTLSNPMTSAVSRDDVPDLGARERFLAFRVDDEEEAR